MATVKSEHYVWNKATSTWDLHYNRTSADLIVETATYKVLTLDERTKISDYLTTFNIANKLVQLDAQGQITEAMVPGGLGFLYLTGGTMVGSINLNGNNMTDINSLIFRNQTSTSKISLSMGDNEKSAVLSVVNAAGDGVIPYTFSNTGVNFSSKLLRSVADPLDGMDAANRRWVEQLVAQGTHIIAAVRVASTGNIATLSGLSTIDGVALAAGDRVLVKNQAVTSENGVYIVDSGAWTKITNDSDKGSLVSVLFGSTQTRHQFYCEGNDSWILYFIDDAYYAAASGGLALESDGFGFKIASSGVTNDMLAGSINVSKLLNFTNVDTDAWGSIASAATSGGLSAKLTDIYSSIKNLRGTVNFNTNNTQTISDLYNITAIKNRIMYGSTLPVSYTGEDGDVYLKTIA